MAGEAVRQVGQHWSASWWGGPLADGTIIVTNPINPTVGIIDLTANADTRAPMYQPSGQGLGDWFNHRVDRYGRLPLPLPFAPMRGSLLAALTSFVVFVGLYAIFSPPGGGWPILFGMAGLIAAVAVFFTNERRFINPAITSVVPEGETSPLAGLRYVPDAVAARPEWEELAYMANSIGPDSASSRALHRLLWSAAGLRVYADSGNLPGESLESLTALRDQAISLP